MIFGKVWHSRAAPNARMTVFTTSLRGDADFPIEILCGGLQVSDVGGPDGPSGNRVTSMAALLLQNAKVILLFLLVVSAIGLSHLGGENPDGSDLAAGRNTRG